MTAKGSKCDICSSQIILIALLICLFIPGFQCRHFYGHSCFSCSRRCLTCHYDSHYHEEEDVCHEFKRQTSDVNSYAKEVIKEFKTKIEKKLNELKKELEDLEESYKSKKYEFDKFDVEDWEASKDPVDKKRLREHRENLRKQKERDKKYEASKERLEKEIKDEMKPTEFKEGTSCVDGGQVGDNVKNNCDSDFNTGAFNKIISDEFGKRCAKGVCHYHHLKAELVCRGTSIQMTFFLMTTLIFVGFSFRQMMSV